MGGARTAKSTGQLPSACSQRCAHSRAGPAQISATSTRLHRRREFCHSADVPSPSVLKRLLQGEGGAAEWQSFRRRLRPPTAAGDRLDAVVLVRDKHLAVDESSAILPHPPLLSVGFSIGMERGGVSRMTELSPMSTNTTASPRVKLWPSSAPPASSVWKPPPSNAPSPSPRPSSFC